MTAEPRAQRIADNEARFRDINEELEAGLRAARDLPEMLRFVCECGDRRCEAAVRLSLDEYEAVRRDSRRFAVVPGHAFPETERVVAGNDRYTVVEKFGDAVRVTDAADRRELGVGGRRDSDPAP